jgi:hypothetical protein
MSYAQWSSFAYYNVSDIVGYNAVNYQALQANINVVPSTLAPNWQLLTTPTPSAVDSLNTLTGNVVLSSADATFTPNSGTGVLDMAIAFPTPAAVNSLNTLQGNVVLTSADATFTPDPLTDTIDMAITFPTPPAAVNSLNTLTGALSLTNGGNITITPSGTNIALSTPSAVNSLNALTGAVSLTSPLDSVGVVVSGQNIQLEQKVFQGTYYKTVSQTIGSGQTLITFDAVASWNNIGSPAYVTQTSPTEFTVAKTGLYQLGLVVNVVINSSPPTTWDLLSNKSISIDIVRSPLAGQAIIVQSSLQAVNSYNQVSYASFYVLAGDVIRTRVINTYSGGVPSVAGITSTFDFNTFFSWTYISP